MLIIPFLSNIEIHMFNIKVYDRNWNFIQTLNEKEISCNFNFNWSVNSGFSSLSFEYYWDLELEHKQRIKIYKKSKAIYQWFITSITRKIDKNWRKQIIKANWLIWLLAFIPYQDWEINNNPGVLIRNIFSPLGFDITPVRDYTSSISIESSNNTTLSFLQQVLNQTADYAFFIDAENRVRFTPYETHHLLTYWDDCYNIDLSDKKPQSLISYDIKMADLYIIRDKEVVKKKEPNHCLGLQNIGATCYMNATIQCLCHVSKLKEYFLNSQLVMKDTQNNVL